MFELSVLALSLCVLIFILVAYHYQFPSQIPLAPVDKENPYDYSKISTNENPDVTHCKAIYARKGGKCPPCGGFLYHPLDIDRDTVVDGVTLKPGKYCVQNDMPTCDENKGILMVNGTSNFRCVCKYPHYFAGPSCSTRVACGGDENIPLVDSDGNAVDTTRNNDYYRIGAHCRCPSYDSRGLSYLGSEFKLTQCILDPCLYPTPNMDPTLGLSQDGRCMCSDIVPNRGDQYTPCSSCKNRPIDVPYGFPRDLTEYDVTLASDCYNEFSLVSDMFVKYPCAILRNPANCGECNILFGVSKNNPQKNAPDPPFPNFVSNDRVAS